MKALKTLSVIAFAMLLSVGCSKKDDPAAAPAASLVGTWNETTSAGTSCEDPVHNYPTTPCFDCLKLVFTATELLPDTHSYQATNTPCPYTISGTSLTFNCPGAGVSDAPLKLV